ncbi:MAG: beta-ketoacyl-[acyl-carrier-protein] synthase II, partial [Bacteroidales bacterium]|nr:beta-ketoacyl-[acyl-carrier-protein] synthase II [Bacteroidales bacterium]
MEERRVVITGTGVISPVGNDIAQFWSALKAGRCGITTLPELQEWGLPVHVAGVVRDFDPVRYGLTVKETRRNDRFCLFAQAAAAQAMQESG